MLHFFAAYLLNCPPPHATAERLLRHLAATGVPFCLATSSHLAHYSLKTTLHTDLFELFDHRVTGGCWLGGLARVGLGSETGWLYGSEAFSGALGWWWWWWWRRWRWWCVVVGWW